MPDLTLHSYYYCQSIENFREEINGYHVTHGHSKYYVYDWSCTCPSFKFGKGKHCKHIEQAKARFCGWDQFIDGEPSVNQDGQHMCPNCGGPVSSRMVGV